MSTIDTFDTGRSFGLSRPSQPYRLPRIIVWLEAAMERRRGRLALLEMTDDQLKDIGVSRSEAHGEANRPFWD